MGSFGNGTIIRLAARCPDHRQAGLSRGRVSGWFAMIGPMGLPTSQVDRLHKAILAIFNDPEIKAAITKQDNFINPTTPDAMAPFLKTEQERYIRLVAKANIKLG